MESAREACYDGGGFPGPLFKFVKGAALHKSKSSAEPTLVYVDDEPDLCESFSELLQEAGIPVRAFQDPQLALDFLNANPQQCRALLTDLQMPKLDGFALVDRIATRSFPVFLISGHIDGAFSAAASQRGFAKVYKKPLDFDLLIQELKELFA